MKGLKKRFGITILALLFTQVTHAQTSTSWNVVSPPRHEIQFPDILGYKTITADLHTHTVFSDGNVWPTVRIDEAWREGLDAICVTDHIEYQPHKQDIPTNHNRPYDLVAPMGRYKNLLVPRGAEITRDTPPGHFNAIFVEDIDAIAQTEFLDSVKAANEQGAFVFWNHQGWKGSELGSWRDVHTTLYENKWLHGMEVANGGTYFPDAHAWCLEKNLTMMGTSDIHAPSMLLKSTPEEHRTMTLVFVEDYTQEALKSALQQGRTVVWYKNQLIGLPKYLGPLFEASCTISEPYLKEKNSYWFDVKNNADVEFVLKRTGEHGPAEITFPPHSTTQLRVNVKGDANQIRLAYTVTNLLVAPETGLTVEADFSLD